MKMNAKLKMVTLIVLLFGTSSLLGKTASYTDNFMVLGVIASNAGKKGVALLKDMRSGRTFASREGNEFSKGSVLKSVNRKSVEVAINGVTYRIDVGDQTASAVASSRSYSRSLQVSGAAEVSRQGDTIKVSRAYKEHMVNAKLSDVLMQAAAVPHRQNGSLVGFRLWEIEPESVFELAGFKNGDIVTAINGNPINNVALAIRLLTSLKNAPEASFGYIRDGQEKQLKVVVQ